MGRGTLFVSSPYCVRARRVKSRPEDADTTTRSSFFPVVGF
jgi:hypothetical protein